MCKKLSFDDSEDGSHKAQDISECAIRLLFSAELVTTGELLRLEFALPNREKAISCTGKVLWVEEVLRKQGAVDFEAGIEFLDIGDEDKAAIQQFTCS